MAGRPLKIGVDYFPHDTNSSFEEKIQFIEEIYSFQGYACYFKLLEKIYANGGELSISDSEIMAVIGRKCGGFELEKFEKFISTCCKINLFDKEQWEKNHILTSHGIKKRFEYITYKRAKDRKLYKKEVSATDNTIIVDSAIGNKSKVKQSKVKESKVNNNTNTKPSYRISFLLWKSIMDSGTVMRQPDLYKWSEEIELLHRVDKKPWDLINRIMQAAREDAFWKKVLRSTKKLRQHIISGQFDKFIPPEYRTDEEYEKDLAEAIKKESG